VGAKKSHANAGLPLMPDIQYGQFWFRRSQLKGTREIDLGRPDHFLELSVQFRLKGSLSNPGARRVKVFLGWHGAVTRAIKTALALRSVEWKRTAAGMNNNEETMRLSEGDKELVCLVAVGLTDDEIATQLQIPKHKVLNRIARLLAKLGAQDRVEIVLYAYSDPTMYQRISTAVIHRTTKRTTKNPQAQTPSVKRKAS
jgi:DNA-binding CsgD family transcriptional regulator